MGNNLRIIAIDPSIRSLGYYDSYTDKSGTFGSKKEYKFSDRFARIADTFDMFKCWMKSLCLMDDENILFLLEDYAFGRQSRSSLDLAELGGLIRYFFRCKKYDWKVVSPTRIKKFITSKGNAKKILVQEHVYRLYNRKFETDDETDAYALYKFYICYLGFDEPRNKKQQEIIDDYKREIENNGKPKQRKKKS